MAQPDIDDTIGIFGGTGWLGGALGRNLLRRGLPPGRLSITNRRGPTADYDAWPGVVWQPDLATLAGGCSVLVLSVRPGDYGPPAPLPFPGVVVSFMGGVTLDRLARDWPRARICRAMPGGGASEGTAHVPFCTAPGMSGADRTRCATILSALGHADQVADEPALSYMAALSGSGAAYPALMAQAMFNHAVARGIPADIAWRAVRSVVCDAPAQFRDGPDRIAALLDTYHGFRGVTSAGLNAAADAGFARAIGAGLDAATAREAGS